MAGKGSRFKEVGEVRPKPFIKIMGKTMIERVLENLNCEGAHFILIAQEKHLEDYADIVNEICNKYSIEFVTIDQITEGAACTCLFARRLINNSFPLVIANSDQIIDIDFQEFIDDCFNKNLDGSIMTFKDLSMDPKWSFAAIGSDGLVSRVAEKMPISNQATVGIYMFKTGSIFIDSAIDMIARNERTSNEFYVCPTYNFAISNNSRIGIYEINQNQMHGLGTPEDLKKFIEKNKKNG